MRYKIKTFIIQIAEKSLEKNLTTPQEVFKFIKNIYKKLDQDQEHFSLIFLDNKKNITGYKTIFSGGQTSALIDPKIIFRNAILFGSAGIVLIHNHPSQNTEPSEGDIVTTQKLKKCAELLDIDLVDHLIISNNSFYSFKEKGLIK